MANDDAFEEDKPRRPRRRPREDEQDEEDEEEFEREQRPRRRAAARSGTVTAVAILAIILGALALVCGSCTSLVGLFFEGFRGVFQKELAKQAAVDPNAAKVAQQMASIPAWWIPVQGILYLVLGVGLLLGGIGTLNRYTWARQLTIAMAVFGVLHSFLIFGMNLTLGPADPAQLVSGLIVPVISIAFAVFVFVVLLNGENAREFTR